MTIHSEHPFPPSDGDRDPVRQLRGRVGGAVSLWTSGAGIDRCGLTVSSYLVAQGTPGRFVALLHEDSDLLERLVETGTAVVALLEWRHRELAEVFAGLFPAPGGPFRVGDWEDTAWGPRLTTSGTWAGVRLDPTSPHAVGWSVMVETTIEHAEVGEDGDALVHRHGRYQAPMR